MTFFDFGLMIRTFKEMNDALPHMEIEQSSPSKSGIIHDFI